MAEDDIYGNKSRYERFVKNLDKVLEKPKESKLIGRRKYYCKNKDNIKYFKKLMRSFEVDDLSYIRRLRLLYVMKFLTYIVACDLKDINCLEKEDIIIEMRKRFSPFIVKKTATDIRTIGNILFKEEDKPIFFKNLKIKVDKSRQKARKDKLSYEEFDRLMKYFSDDIVMQAYLSLAFESLARPQELCYLKIGDIEFYDNYAKLSVSEHGKEGIKKLLSIDSFPYLLKMYNNHKDRENKTAFLFLNEYGNQLTPFAVNKKLKIGCKKLKIDKPVTCYSIKRFGVTFRSLRGDSPTHIAKIANWTSTKQLKTYDLSDQEDVFKIELAKRGLIKDDKFKRFAPKTKECVYCGELVGFTESICPKCKHIQDRNLIQRTLERAEKDKIICAFVEHIMKDTEILNKVEQKVSNDFKALELLRQLRS
jgi:integrase